MELIYPFLITFTLVFFSELGDKTQLLVLSFSTKNKAIKATVLKKTFGFTLEYHVFLLEGIIPPFSFYIKC